MRGKIDLYKDKTNSAKLDESKFIDFQGKSFDQVVHVYEDVQCGTFVEILI